MLDLEDLLAEATEAADEECQAGGYLTPAWLASKFRELGLGATFHSPITAIPPSATERNNFVWNLRRRY
jgi:hypothetical protein